MSAPRYPVLLSAVEIVEGVNDTIAWRPEGITPLSVVVPPGTYYLRGGGAGGSLWQAVAAALAPVVTVDEPALSIDPSAPSLRITASVANSTLAPFSAGYWEFHASTTFPLHLLGWAAGVPSEPSGDMHVIASRSSPAVWVSPQPFVTREPRPRRPATTQHETPERGIVYTFTAADTRRDRVLALAHIAGARALKERNPADPAASFEAWWELANDGRDVELHLPICDDETTLEAPLDASTRLCTVVLTGDSLLELPLSQSALSPPRYAGDVRFIEVET